MARSSCPIFKWDSGPDNFSTYEDASVKAIANKSSSDHPSCDLFGPPAIHFHVPLNYFLLTENMCCVSSEATLFFNVCDGQPTTW